MSAKKKAAATAPEAKTAEPKAVEAAEAAGVEPFVALPNVYRTDLGESLPPQKYAGVE